MSVIVARPVALPGSRRNPHFDVPSSFFAAGAPGSEQSTSDRRSFGPSRPSARAIIKWYMGKVISALTNPR